MDKIVALIPARGGSKGIPRKNIKELAGKPLIAYSILSAIKSKQISEVYVSTEDSEIADIASDYGAIIVERPDNLASDTATSETVLLHFAEKHEFDILIFMQCTSPLTNSMDLDQALLQFVNENNDSMLSVTKDHGGFLCGGFTWVGNKPTYDVFHRPRRQDVETKFRENGAFYITTKKALLESKNRLSGEIGTFIMPFTRSYEIDEPQDFKILEQLFPVITKKSIDTNILGQIKLVIFDVDGVFTDGSVYVDQEGNELLQFSRIDGKGIELLRNNGLKLAVISSEQSDIVAKRMKKLQISHVYLGIKDKIVIYEKIKHEFGLNDNQICYCGDDIQDIEVMKRSGFACAPKNAQIDVIKYADYLSVLSGGNGFVRDVANLLLNAH